MTSPHGQHPIQHQQQPAPATLSRRQVLRAFGLLGAVMGACAIGGAGGLLWLAGQREDDTPRIVITTPQPTGATAISTPTTNGYVPAPLIVRRDEWGAFPPDHAAQYESGFYSPDNPEGWRVYDEELHQVYNTLIIHHSVIDLGDDGATLLDIQRLHREDRRWADVAYHFFIGKTGNIYEGRDIGVRGTHTGGYNTGSLGICFLGNYEEIALNALQLQSFNRLMQWLLYRLQPTHIAGHLDFNNFTQCPGANITLYIPQWATQYGLQEGIEGYVPPNDASSSDSTNACSCGAHHT